MRHILDLFLAAGRGMLLNSYLETEMSVRAVILLFCSTCVDYKITKSQLKSCSRFRDMAAWTWCRIWTPSRMFFEAAGRACYCTPISKQKCLSELLFCSFVVRWGTIKLPNLRWLPARTSDIGELEVGVSDKKIFSELVMLDFTQFWNAETFV